MSLLNLHKILAIAYFLPPLLFYLIVEDMRIGNVDLDSSVTIQLALVIALFMLGAILVTRTFSKILSPRISQALNYISIRVNKVKLAQLHAVCILIILYYLIKIWSGTQFAETRDELFDVLESSLGPLFMLSFKVGIFLSALSLIKKTNYLYVVAFVSAVIFINIITLSRSMIVVMIVALLPFVRIKSFYVIAGLLIIFLSRFIFTDNISLFSEGLSLDIEWLRIFGFGEMLGVTFGPYAIMQAGGLDPSLMEQLGFIFHSIPGISLIATHILDVPEIAIYSNQFTYHKYGVYGVAGTGYLDMLIAPVVFIYLCAIIALSLILFRFTRVSDIYQIILSCAFIACALATIQLYRWSLSGFVYTTARDCLIFVFIFFVIRKVPTKEPGGVKINFL